jgi:hypothetical protein
MSEVEKPTTAFILSLVAGIFIVLGGVMMSMIGSFGLGGMTNGYWGSGGMMGGYRWRNGLGFGMMSGYGFSGMFGLAGVLIGLAVIVGALMLYNNPAQHSKWGLVILIF